ncbi:F-box/LRR-repeat protein 2 [Camellia lanceoleosa]|uniref:F-box/LRR-repeat protein 2 n=1 Tax=Camellia lanceoleosa TaxID=1840588 RepID=A0ACC0FER9_9ERIC|nr:F-box/LRR-repeat protein 2 [Camellia lanceoleosa]
MKLVRKELSEDCWELILNRLAIDDFNHLQSPSLVCKLFLSITDRLRLKLEVSNRLFYSDNCEGLFRALQRFTNLKEFELRVPFFGDKADVNYPIRRITAPSLDHQSIYLTCLLLKTFLKLGSTMKNLKILRFCLFECLQNHHLVAIADALPWLEELDIRFSCYYWSTEWNSNSRSAKYLITDAGIEVMSCKLRGLRKIDITGQVGCSDRSLIALSSNCVLLNEIRCGLCKVTEHGICFVLRHSRNLICFKVESCYSSPDNSFTFENSMIYATSLRDLALDPHGNHDRLICSIATAGIQLEKIVLYDDSGLSLHGLSTFLCACPSLTHLMLGSIKILTDNYMRDLCRYLPNLVSITIDGCSNLTTATFFILAKECPVLSEIEMPHINLHVEDDFDMDLERNYRIRSLDLSCARVNNKFLKKVGVVCPNLQTLDVSGLYRLTEGIEDILKCCSQMKHLTVDRTREIVILLEQFKTRCIKIEHHFNLEERI